MWWATASKAKHSFVTHATAVIDRNDRAILTVVALVFQTFRGCRRCYNRQVCTALLLMSCKVGRVITGLAVFGVWLDPRVVGKAYNITSVAAKNRKT